MGCIYELNHSLQKSMPVQLKSVRVVVVITRTEVNATLRFPSVVSLHTHFKNTRGGVVSGDRNKRIRKGESRVHPELDEEYVLNLKLAAKLMIRQILPSEFSKKNHLKSFWTTLTSQQPILAATPVHNASDDYCVSDDDGNCEEARVACSCTGLNLGTENCRSNLCCSSPGAAGRLSSGGSSRCDSHLVMRKMGTCWSALTNISDLRWGVRRRVAFFGQNKDNSTNEHYQEDNKTERIDNKRITRKKSNNCNYTTTTNRALGHRYHKHQSSLGIFEEAVPEEEEQDEEEVSEDDDSEYHCSLERRSLRSRKFDRSSKQLIAMRGNRKTSNNSTTTKRKIKPQGRKEEEEDDSDDEWTKPTRRATRSPATAAGLKIKIKKNTERSNKNNQIVIHSKKQLVSATLYHRWSEDRYRKAEVKMLEIMKEKGAVSGAPVTRRVLRMEAAKYIGDTGLLDHILKHIAGTVAPDSELRFQRRCNPEGELEYWLENADLVNIRKEAGIKNPFWTPPPGWMPGDNPSQDPLCAKDIRFLKQEMSTLKRNVEEIMYTHRQQKKKNNRDCSGLVLVPGNNPISTDSPLVEADDGIQDQSLVPKLQVSVSPITTITSPIADGQHYYLPQQNPLRSSHSSEEGYSNLMKRKAQLEQQLLEISNSLNDMQEEVWKLTTRFQEAGTSTTIAGAQKSSSVLTVVDDSNTRKRKAADEKALDDQVWVRPERSVDHEKVVREKQKVDDEKETKEEKCRRLRSGFRICKPQGSFLRPNIIRAAASSPANSNSNSCSSCSNMMMMSPTATYDQSHVVLTPTSVSSSTTSKSDFFFLPLPPPQYQETHLATPAAPPVNPLLEKSSAVTKV